MSTLTEEQREERRADMAEIREEMKCRKYYSCPDRMCGANDCPNCMPGNFRGGVLIEDQPDSL